MEETIHSRSESKEPAWQCKGCVADGDEETLEDVQTPSFRGCRHAKDFSLSSDGSGSLKAFNVRKTEGGFSAITTLSLILGNKLEGGGAWSRRTSAKRKTAVREERVEFRLSGSLWKWRAEGRMVESLLFKLWPHHLPDFSFLNHKIIVQLSKNSILA